VVNPESAHYIFEKLNTQYKEIIAIRSKHHGILMDNTAGTWESIDRFFHQYVTP
jgi:esterase/lipase